VHRAFDWSEALNHVRLPGRRATAAELELLKARLSPLMADWCIWLMGAYDVIGYDVVLEPSDDPSGLGVEFRWMTPEQIISEATESEPGIAAGRHGLAPIGLCLSGSGDPYFVNTLASDNPPVVRIPHEAVHDGELDLAAIEVVSPSLSAFLIGSA
jgi:hypothetical protein